MQVGFGSITCQRYPGDPRSDGDRYREALALAEEAERLGFDSVWVSEHHFFDDSYLPSVLPFCAAIAACTSRLTVGTDVLLAPLYEPIRLAEDAATVDLLSGGRFVLGLAQGWRPEEFEGLGIPLKGRHRRLEDVVTTLRQAWSGQLVTGGTLVRYPGVAVRPEPAQPGGPPIWIGAGSEPAVRRAGRIADGFLASWGTVESFGQQVSWVRDELVRSGRDPDGFTIGVVLPTFAWAGNDAWERVRESFYYYAWKYEDMADARGRAGPPPAPPPLGSAPEAELRSLLVMGTPDAVAERLLAFREAGGANFHYIAEFCWPGMDPAILREAMAIFAGEVIPQLR